MKKNKQKDSELFEVQFNKLKEIVSEIESTEHNIDKMIALFEEGVELSTYCERKIEEYKKKINTIVSNDKGKLD